jgi:hypothetical protein
MPPLNWISGSLVVFAAVAGAAMLIEREKTSALRGEIQLLREENGKIERLRVQHERLKAAQVPEAELERLRADHAALERLRTEVATIKARAEEMALNEAKAALAPASQGAAARSGEPPSLALGLGFNAGGGLILDGKPLDLVAFRQRLAVLARGARVDVRVRVPDSALAARFPEMKQTIDQMQVIARDLGLRMSIQMQDFVTEVR